jgi:putative hemolysin
VEEKINQLVQERAPWLVNGSFLSKTIYTFLKKFLKFGETIYVGDHIQGMSGAEAFNWLGSEYTSNCEIEGLENIPKDGKCLLVSNHPMGAADAVSLYHQIYKVREDVFFFANELFVYLLGSFKDVMAPVVWNKEKEIHSATKVTLERLNTFFGNERIGIIFPSGRLSKLTIFGVWDRPWEKTPITLAKKYDFPVIPVYIDAKNSWFFYFASYVNKQLRDVSQLNELLNKKQYKFTVKIGKPIKHTDLSSHNDIAIQQLRYKSESLKRGFFKLKRFLYLRQYKN